METQILWTLEKLTFNEIFGDKPRMVHLYSTEYYTEELKKSPEEKIKALRYQKYYTGGAIILMFIVLICMYLILK